MKRGLIGSVATALLLSTPVPRAEVADDPDVQAGIYLAREWLEARLEYDRVPGASIAVVADQETVWSQGFGYASVEGEVAATADTLYSICSVSKLFTSIAVMQLRDAGRLSLDAPIDSILPWYELPPHENAEEAVTLRNILSHVAGLPREAVTPYWTEENFPDHDTLRTGVGEQQALYVPYARFQYSNLGMSLAGEAVAAASGVDYHAYIRDRVLGPLGMSDTRSELPVEEYGSALAAGYRLPAADGRRPEVGPYTLNAIAPAAGFASSANDLARFAKWQFRLRDKGGSEVLRATTLREMQRLQWADADLDGPMWGLGFALSKLGDKLWVGHGGYCPGYRTAFLTRPKDRAAVIMMVNVNDVSPGGLAANVIELLGPAVLAAVDPDDESETREQGKGDDNSDTPAQAPGDGETLNGGSSAQQPEPDLGIYQGVYGRAQMPTRMAVAATSKGLGAINLFSEKPAASRLDLRHAAGHSFRVYSKDDEPLDQIRFDLDENGRAVRLWRHGQYMDRLE